MQIPFFFLSYQEKGDLFIIYLFMRLSCGDFTKFSQFEEADRRNTLSRYLCRGRKNAFHSLNQLQKAFFLNFSYSLFLFSFLILVLFYPTVLFLPEWQTEKFPRAAFPPAPPYSPYNFPPEVSAYQGRRGICSCTVRSGDSPRSFSSSPVPPATDVPQTESGEGEGTSLHSC